MIPEIAVSDDFDNIVQVGGGNVIADKVYLRYPLRTHTVVHLPVDKFDRRARAQVRAADTDYDQHLAGLLDLFRGLLDAREFLFIIGLGQIDPAQKIISCARAGMQHILRRLHQRGHLRNLFLSHEAFQPCQLEFHCHDSFPFPVHCNPFPIVYQ